MNAVEDLARKRLRTILSMLAHRLTRWAGFDVLNKAQSRDYLRKYLIFKEPGSQISLPEVRDAAHPERVLFAATELTTEPSKVWSYEPGRRKATLLPSGGVWADHKLFYTDFGNRHFLNDLVHPGKRRTHVADTVIAPFSHRFDGWVFVGYYDYLVLIAAKLCRIKNALPEADFQAAVVAYPLLGTTYERDLLQRIGFTEDRVFDSRTTKIVFNRCILGNGTNDAWYYPNVVDLMALRQHLVLPSSAETRVRNRIYISRAGRRRILNEDELRTLLIEYDFQIIEDEPRSIAEQMAIYHDASFIVSPHGASLTNLLWCQPGTRLLELFSPTYLHPHFRYLAQVMGVEYVACLQQVADGPAVASIEQPVVALLPEVRQSVIRLLGE